MGKSSFETFKDDEYRGDKLLDLIIIDILLENGLSRNEVGRVFSRFTTNQFLAEKIFPKIGINVHSNDLTVPVKESGKIKGNAVEEWIWRTFKEKGYFFVKNEIKNCIDETYSRSEGVG
jgi:hypothetical protein